MRTRRIFGRLHGALVLASSLAAAAAAEEDDDEEEKRRRKKEGVLGVWTLAQNNEWQNGPPIVSSGGVSFLLV